MTLPDFVNKTTDKAVKRIKSSMVPEFNNKGNKSSTKQITASWTKNRSSNKCN